jgi:hypothetical protein
VTVQERPVSETEQVELWREHCFLELGANPTLARYLARLHTVDVHEYARLVDDGCPPQLAARILA